MSQALSFFQRRVLGVLIEKALAQPAYYPMTLNAIAAACNQKNNRDPEMSVDEETVYQTLEELRGLGLVTRVLTSGGRTDRFKHLANEVYGWDGKQRAVMAEFLLRGPQTLAELRTRCSRMTPFDSAEHVTAVLDALAAHDPPFVMLLPRAPGQREARYTHLMYPPDEAPLTPKSDAAHDSVGQRSGDGGALKADIEAIQNQLVELQRAVDRLEQRLDTLEGR
ncbi:MAG: YceH family protein [Phycisphaerales bacterium]|nr:YceH family protein [Phycisphaerales bacterium]